MTAGWRTILLAGAFALAGCAVTPGVEYHVLSEGPHPDNWVLFRLTDSVIVVGSPSSQTEAKAAAAPVSLGVDQVDCTSSGCGPLAAAVAPGDFEDVLFALEPRTRKLIETRLTPTYQTSSLRLKQISVEAKDHRMEAINTLGAIASGAANLMMRSGEDNTEQKPERPPGAFPLKVPFTLDLAEARCESEAGDGCVSAVVHDPAGPSRGAPQPLPENTGWSYALRFLDNPRRAGLVARADLARVHTAMVGAVCRPALLELFHGGEQPVASLRVTVADPDWLETAPFPTKGAMSFQPLCGIDVQAEAVTTVGVDALTAAFFNNVAAVRAAQKK